MTKPLSVKYVPSRAGFRELGVSSVASKAAGRAAGAVLSAVRELDPDGDYTVMGVGTRAGFDNEPRNAAVVEGNMFPGAHTAALLTAVNQLASQQRGR